MMKSKCPRRPYEGSQLQHRTHRLEQAAAVLIAPTRVTPAEARQSTRGPGGAHRSCEGSQPMLVTVTETPDEGPHHPSRGPNVAAVPANSSLAPILIAPTTSHNAEMVPSS